ncbi:Rieske (2Fe-2S) protein [Alteribacillus iranensis]|uniref:3-phenylpropionate/trans-cinnamate dioxygenase ferredoxin subunit/anthranilate 1,2-dioxygenase large subunit n=1 Tax=Alteribacillus iranensis TaxID=930128 RepID=A0A1I2DJD7_9BACI|nr:non-heme iron oxygenase ferredoxin subunit [Alteribacillus iranensis]SFE80421.1 3-phenylpropionate/trans-cinnamate dioxygenase ferredoxin subunit/anthranilate 1,2-dioxygenase large subunit [Alteribacillus iranensis]
MIDKTNYTELTNNGYHFVGYSTSIPDGEMQELTVGKEVVLIARIDGNLYAVDGICSHAYAELVDGELDEHCLYCPLHFACFDVRNGEVLEGPATEPLPVFDVTEENGEIWVKV